MPKRGSAFHCNFTLGWHGVCLQLFCCPGNFIRLQSWSNSNAPPCLASNATSSYHGGLYRNLFKGLAFLTWPVTPLPLNFSSSNVHGDSGMPLLSHSLWAMNYFSWIYECTVTPSTLITLSSPSLLHLGHGLRMCGSFLPISMFLEHSAMTPISNWHALATRCSCLSSLSTIAAQTYQHSTWSASTRK
jgi:hypothetical protein